MKKLSIYTLLIALVMLLAGCGGKEMSTDIFRFEQHRLDVEKGATAELRITGNFDKNLDIVYSVAEEGKEVVKIKSEDKLAVIIEGLKVGETKVFATLQGKENKTATMNIVVTEVKTKSLTINAPKEFKNTMKIGEQLQFEVVLNPVEGNKVTWSTTNPNIAEVNQTGLLVAKAGGMFDLVVTSLDKKVEGRITIFVEYPPTTSLKVTILENNSKATNNGANMNKAYLRELIQLGALVTPADANPNVICEIISGSGATVDSIGRVTSNVEGKVVVRMGYPILKDNKIVVDSTKPRSEIELDFKNAPVERIDVTIPGLTNNIIALKEGEILKLSTNVVPSNASQRVKWQIYGESNLPERHKVTGQLVEKVRLYNPTNSNELPTHLEACREGEVQLVATNEDGTILSEIITVKITERRTPNKIQVLTLPEAFRKIIKMHAPEIVDIHKDGEDLSFIAYERLQLQVATDIVSAHQGFIIEFKKNGISITDKIAISSPTISGGITYYDILFLDPNLLEFEIIISYQWADYYKEEKEIDILPIVKKVKLIEHVFEIDYEEEPVKLNDIEVYGVNDDSQLGTLIDALELYYNNNERFEDIKFVVKNEHGDVETSAIIISENEMGFTKNTKGTFYVEVIVNGEVLYTFKVNVAIME